MPCRAALVRAQHGRGRSSEVERQLPKLNVAGSIPAARSSVNPNSLADGAIVQVIAASIALMMRVSSPSGLALDRTPSSTGFGSRSKLFFE